MPYLGTCTYLRATREWLPAEAGRCQGAKVPRKLRLRQGWKIALFFGFSPLVSLHLRRQAGEDRRTRGEDARAALYGAVPLPQSWLPICHLPGTSRLTAAANCRDFSRPLLWNVAVARSCASSCSCMADVARWQVYVHMLAAVLAAAAEKILVGTPERIRRCVTKRTPSS